jgi:hypothetical protein
VPAAAAELLSYRVHGGPVRVDQRLTLFEDGSGELDEHHRSRDSIRLELSSGEIDRIRTLIDALPEGRLASRAWLREITTPGRAQVFQLRLSGRSIRGVDVEDPTLAELISLLDEIRLRAIRSQPR